MPTSRRWYYFCANPTGSTEYEGFIRATSQENAELKSLDALSSAYGVDELDLCEPWNHPPMDKCKQDETYKNVYWYNR